MSTSRLAFHQRLVGRILLFGLLPVTLVVALIVGMNAYRAYGSFLAATERELAEATRLAAVEVEAGNRAIAALVETMGQAQTEGGMFGKRAETLAYLRAILLAQPSLQGTYVLYEPNADGNDVAALGSIPREALDTKGRFVPYVRRDAAAPEGMRLEPTIGMEDFPDYLFYLGPRKAWESTGRSEVLFTKPYEYEGVRMIEQTYPLIREGRFVGISGADRTLDELGRQLAESAKRLGGDYFLTTTSIDGIERYITATTDASVEKSARLETREVAGTPLASIIAQTPSTAGGVKVVAARDPVLDEDCFYGVTKTETGNWTLVVRKPGREALAAIWTLVLTNTLTALGGIVVIALLLYLLARGVGRRLHTATEVAERIAQGDLTEQLTITPPTDESGVLLNAFAVMNQNLAMIARDTRRASIGINSTATELSASAVQQEEVASGLSSSTTEVAAATREIAATGGELLGTLDAIAKSARGAADQASEGRQSVQSMNDAMRRLDEAAQSVGSKLQAMNEKAQGINAIVATITKVADQTNLLSVNAAIEAEKAGELGLGFLVVAREIRRLADQTGEATLDIERVIRQMQSAVSSGVMEMDRFGESLRACVEGGEAVGHRLEGIIRHVEGDTARVGQVTEGMRAQSAGVGQIDEAMRSLQSTAKRSSVVASDISRASTALQDAIKMLKSAVGSFRLRD